MGTDESNYQYESGKKTFKISEDIYLREQAEALFDQVKNTRQQEVSPMDSIVSVNHQYVSGTANASSCEERDLC